MKKSKRSPKSPPPYPVPPFPMLSRSNRPMRSFPIPLRKRPTLSSVPRTECLETRGIKRETRQAALTESESKSRQNDHGLLHRRFSGQLVLCLLIRCTARVPYNVEAQADLAVYRPLCVGRCRGRIAEGNFGVCQKSQSGSESLCPRSQRTVVMRSSRRTRNGCVHRISCEIGPY
jgi:hypothetical protein